MDKIVLLISGMPASGKDTITNTLCNNDKYKKHKFSAFKKHRSYRANEKIKDSYINISETEFLRKISDGDFLQYHQRYGRYYGIDTNTLIEDVKHSIPIIHVGRLENYDTILASARNILDKQKINIRFIHILLWNKKDVLKKRITDREQSDEKIGPRVTAMDEEFNDNIRRLLISQERPYQLIIKNETVEATCDRIISFINSHQSLPQLEKEFLSYLKYLNDNEAVVDLSSFINRYNTGESKSVDWSNKNLPPEIHDIKFDGVVTLQDSKTSTNQLKIQHCSFEYLRIKKEDKHGEIERFNFSECRIEQIHIYQCEQVSFTFTDCVIGRITVDSGTLDNVIFNKTSIGDILLVHDAKIGSIRINSESNIEKIDSKDAKIDSLSINAGSIGTLRLSKEIQNIEIRQGGFLEQLAFTKEKDLIHLLKSLDAKRREIRKESISARQTEAVRQKLIALAALNFYEYAHRYKEVDHCLYSVRAIDNAVKKLEAKGLWANLGYAFERIILGRMFGWGINIFNTLVTSLIIILSYAGVYLILPNGHNTIWGCIEISVNRFFNINEVNPQVMMPILDSSEQIIGVLMMTILTGVIVRKIIK